MKDYKVKFEEGYGNRFKDVWAPGFKLLDTSYCHLNIYPTCLIGRKDLFEKLVDAYGFCYNNNLIDEIASIPVGVAFEYLTKWYIFELDENGCFSIIKKRRHHICIPTPNLDAYHRETGVF